MQKDWLASLPRADETLKELRADRGFAEAYGGLGLVAAQFGVTSVR